MVAGTAYRLNRWAPREVGRLLQQLVLLLLISAAGTGCQVKFVADYDETTDRMATDLQKQIDDKFAEWLRLPPGSPALQYSANTSFYAGVDGNLRALKGRASAQPLNKNTVAIIDVIIKSMESVEKQHKSAGTISQAALGSVEDQLDFQFQQLIQLELAKKRGG
jgi:hypothetical protein